MRCDQCRHWLIETRPNYGDWEAAEVGFGECKAVRERWIIQDDAGCGLDRFSDEPNAEDRWIEARRTALRAARAYVQDGSEYRAELYTAPDFFCALFAARTQDERENPTQKSENLEGSPLKSG